MELTNVEHPAFRQNGFIVVKNLLASHEVKALGKQADRIVEEIKDYQQHDAAERQRLEVLHREHCSLGAPRSQEFSRMPELRITDGYARRGDRVYPLRKHAIDEASAFEARDSQNPWTHLAGTINHLADNDGLFRRFAGHPKIVKVLTQILSPNIKLWFDHLYNKPPYNDGGLYGGANRFHQDGFFQYDRRSVTCWIALDEVTVDNGCFHYIPLTAGYGQVRFDEGVAVELKAAELAQARLVTLKPGDAAFHDRWTMHATGPNETGRYRRGWAMHYCDAASRYGDFAEDPGWENHHYRSPDGVHLRNGTVHGNRHYPLVTGREFPGRV